MCTDSDEEVVSFLKDPPVVDLNYWAYNLTNAFDYANGQTAEMYELGPYSLEVAPKTANVDFSESAGTLSFDKYNTFKFRSSSSCSDCKEDDVVNVVNAAYLKVLGGARHEALLLMSATCTETQIGLISDASGTYNYCATNEMGTPTACKCCAPTPTSGATTCTAIASRTSRAGGLHSWLAKYDNGLKLDSATSAYALSTGTYTSLVRKVSVTELPFGTVSVHLGLVATAKAIRGGDKVTMYENSNTTNDLRDACYALNCPQLSDVVAAVGTQGMTAIKNVDCTGTVPSYKVLMAEGGLSEERAKELRYLEGVSCKPFGVPIAFGAALAVDGTAVYTCADGSTNIPCCLSSFQSSTMGSGVGMGCHAWVNGLIQRRRVYNMDEAYKHIRESPRQMVSVEDCVRSASSLNSVCV